MEEKEITCIVCPTGCSIHVKRLEDGTLSIEGNQCKRGYDYAETEFIEPKRILATTIRIEMAKVPLVPVRTDEPVPKEKLDEILDFLANIKVKAPVNCGDVLVEHVLGLDANIIATRTLGVDTCDKIACEI
ncbi:DUF1667 domain-containing protein [Candidatus Bathyarchaeota archaeon]|nr:DUF1667 domain-containing protein [Candidatus Bathyarchaeota archaeon]